MLPLAAAATARLIPTATVPGAPGVEAAHAMTEEMAESMREAVQKFADAAQAAADVARSAAEQVSPPPPPPAETGSGINWSHLDFDTVMLLINQYGVPVVKALIILFLAWLLASWARRVVLTSFTRARLDITLAKFLSNAARWGILILAVLMILSVFGIQTASFAVVIGALGLAIGLAFQGTLSNIASGVMLLVFRPFKVGDVVNIAGMTGTVDEIELFFTTINTADNRRLIIPNSKIFGETIENITFHPKRRVEIPVGVDYAAPIDATRTALERAVERVEAKLDGEAHQVWLDSLADSSVQWRVRVWCASAKFGDCHQQTVQRVKESLDEAKIGIPFPQMDVRVVRTDQG